MIEAAHPLIPPVTSSNIIDRNEWHDQMNASRQIGTMGLKNVIHPMSMMEVEDGLEEILREDIIRFDTDQAIDPISHEEIVDPDSEHYKELVEKRVQIFLEHKHATLEESHEGLVQLWPEVVPVMEKGTQRGIKLGFIPPVVSDRLKKASNETTIRVVDSAIIGENHGMYNSDTDEIGINHEDLLGSMSQIPVETLVHELTHQVSGGTFRRHTAENESGARRPRTGFSNDMSLERTSRVGLNEAVTQHLAMGITTGDFETIDPDMRSDGDKIYYGYRKALAGFVDRSGGIVKVRTITNAYFEDTGVDGSTDARRALVRQATVAYGPGAFTKLEKLCEAAEFIPMSRVAELIDEVIKPPRVAPDGTVLEVGSIDTKKLDMLYVINKYLPVVSFHR